MRVNLSMRPNGSNSVGVPVVGASPRLGYTTTSRVTREPLFVGGCEFTQQ